MTTDFIKIKVSNNDLKQYFWSHPLLYFHSDSEILLFDNETIHTKRKKQYNGILFEFTKHALYIYFKPHYHFNNNLHNANDFNVLNCINTLREFTDTFKVDAKELQIINIEFGLNIVIPKSLICVKDFLTLLTYHGQNQFYTDSKYSFCKYSTTTNCNGKTNVYKIIKCYAKGIQFPEYTDLNTFRFEVKSNRKNYIESLGIKNLNDLLEPSTYQTLENIILEEFDKILIIDDQARPGLSKTKLDNHNKKLNPIYWHKLLNKSKNVFRKNFKLYYDTLNTCETHLKKEVRKLIFDKLQALKKCAVLTPYTKQKKCAVLTLYKDEIGTHLFNRCLVTGLNISMQRSDSILLSHTGLKYYYKTERFTFDRIKNKYLSTNWINSDYQIQIKEIAHNIRNKHSNLKIRNKLIYNSNQKQLF
ncbi:hypothetical protein [Ichthyenterobacterium magnum]|uniref:Uncharacterized protein n=1 Tax=Ichthyenterobacterium magnum TaxID=1230530 RepID=A0A420DFP8_9FLAO|nr:hypothetical protein [Ichthyenterobacterium magnum]RKE91905.1 hypothetical protein BXY80_2334 [Ichthyenterobacterium magnum]